MGELPAPPVELAFVAYAIAAAGLSVGTYTVISGHLLLRVGLLKQIWSKKAARLIGLSLVIESLIAVWLARDTVALSHHAVPSPDWLGIIAFPAALAGFALQHWAYHIDRPLAHPGSLV
ncbi:MAG: hypothetical protein QOH92_2056 [Chloroflexota bacterium]|jgi:hypothetical protein|nr:hypothetical protein [Chloroflexota bacterium]